MKLSLSRGIWRRGLPLAVAVFMAVAVAWVRAPQVAAATYTYPYVRVYLDSNKGGQSFTFQGMCDNTGVCWYTGQNGSAWDLRSITGPCQTLIGPLFGNWNDCISSIYIYNPSPYNLCAIAYNDPGTYINPGVRVLYKVPYNRLSGTWNSISYNDMISAIDIIGPVANPSGISCR